MKSILEDLDKIPARKHVVTSIEYSCESSRQQNEVFDAVTDILTNGLDAFSKITYDVLPAEQKVKVEVSQNK